MNRRLLAALAFALTWPISAAACDYPPDYVYPTNEQQLLQARKQSKFAFVGIVASSKLISTAQEIEDGTFRVESKVKVLWPLYGDPPKQPSLYYVIESDPGAACSPLEPHVGEMFYFFDSNTSSVDNLFEKSSNVRAQIRRDTLTYDESRKFDALLLGQR